MTTCLRCDQPCEPGPLMFDGDNYPLCEFCLTHEAWTPRCPSCRFPRGWHKVNCPADPDPTADPAPGAIVQEKADRKQGGNE